MNKEIIGQLDQLLLLLSTKYLGVSVVSKQLLLEIGVEAINHKSLFLIEILLSDGYATKGDYPNASPVIVISPLGYRFFNSGGYTAFLKSNYEDLSNEQTKQKLEIVNLRWGLRISVFSLIIAVAALLISVLEHINKH